MPTKTGRFGLATLSALTAMSLVISLANFQSMVDTKYTNLDTKEHDSKNDEPQGCLTLDFKNDMDNLLAKYKQVFVVFPAKAAGSTMKRFAKKCMRTTNSSSLSEYDNILNHAKDMKEAFTEVLKMPSLISSHLYTSRPLLNLAKHATRDSLIIYSHREETARVKSGIKEVVWMELCRKQQAECKIKEEKLVDMIASKIGAIGFGSTEVLTCETYKSIRDNSPNMVFMHYTQADQLTKLLAKHHCPGTTVKRANVGSKKKLAMVELGGLENNGTLVDVDDWLNAKIELIEYFLNLKKDASCQMTTRMIENQVFACPDEIMQISGRSYENRQIQFQHWLPV